MKEYVDSVFCYYREHGFPFYPTDVDWRKKEWEKLKTYASLHDVLDENGNLRQTMHGLALAGSFHPHMFSIECNGMKTPMQLFNDDTLFRKVIERRIKIGDNMSDSGMRKMLKIFTGSQCVSNFRPTAACALYNKYADGGIVWDMSGGYGGRMLGFAVSRAAGYLYTEPATQTANGLNEMSDWLKSNGGCNKAIAQIDGLKGSEYADVSKYRESIDFCFTSPPYFNTEHYSYEPTQSFVRYDTKEAWRTNFLLKTFMNCRDVLKPGRKMAINIANVKTYPNLEEDCVKTALEAGFSLCCTHRYLLSNFAKDPSNITYKTEPVFVFSKQ